MPFTFRHGTATNGYGIVPRIDRGSVIASSPMAAMHPRKPENGLKVLCISGCSRSGTTLLGKLLNEVDGFFFVGEMSFLWSEWLVSRNGGPSYCGCGDPLDTCEFWGEVLQHWAANDSGDMRSIIEQALSKQTKALGWANLLRILAGSQRAPQRSRAISEYAQVLGDLYRSIAEVSGASVIIDSSKLPIYTALTAVAPGITTYPLHIVRDPRGVVYSHTKSLDKPLTNSRRPRPRKALVAYKAFSWGLRNVTVGITARRLAPDRSLRVTYEELVAQPRRVLQRIPELVDEPVGEMLFLRDRSAILGPNHVAHGNRNRATVGEIALREDRAWAKHLSTSDRLIVDALTLLYRAAPGAGFHRPP